MEQLRCRFTTTPLLRHALRRWGLTYRTMLQVVENETVSNFKLL